jgi:uncharacterized membrane protein
LTPYLLDWLNLLVRWLHLIAGIAWIGASFYFVMLDLSLARPKRASDAERGVFGELWAVHGGGFYVSQKFLVGPRGEPLSEDLHWSKWEAYTTWLSGMAMMAIVYWFGAGTYLIDRNVLALSPWEAIGISVATLALGWLVYDALCRALEGRDALLAALLLVLVMGAAWGLFHVFSGRAAYLHVGAMLGTMMAANVFFHIIPGQKRMVADIRAGREPDPRPGIVGKQRSVHNTYFTLPVLFTMISNHYPMTYSHPHGWLVLGGLMLAGVLIRQHFVLRHMHAQKTWLLVAAGALLAVLVVWLGPSRSATTSAAADYASVRAVFDRRCVTCHAAQPTREGFLQPPKGVMLETSEEVAQHAAKIAETVGNRYMPIGNLTQMTDDERAIVAQWFAAGAPTR